MVNQNPIVPKHSVGRVTSEMWVAGTAIFVSLCALFLAFYEVNIMRKQYKAQIWPYVQLSRSTLNGFRVVLHNKGVGPAIVEGVEIRVDGKPVKTWRELFKVVFGDKKINFIRSTFNGAVLAANDQLEVLIVEKPDMEFWQKFQKFESRITMKYVYRSIQKEYWQVELGGERKKISNFNADKESQFLQ